MPKGVYKRTDKHNQQLIRARSFISEESKKKLSESLKGNIPWNKGKKGLQKFTDEQKKIHSEMAKRKGFGKWMKNKTGEKHNNWKGGITRNKHGNAENRLWRTKVFERDSWTCQTCQVRGIYLEAHHIKSWSQYPELRYEIDNGVTLCKLCHSLTDNYKGKANGKIK